VIIAAGIAANLWLSEFKLLFYIFDFCIAKLASETAK